jgi:hypothetical protein
MAKNVLEKRKRILHHSHPGGTRPQQQPVGRVIYQPKIQPEMYEDERFWV